MKNLMILPLLSVAVAICMPPLVGAENCMGVETVYAAPVSRVSEEVIELDSSDKTEQYLELMDELEITNDKFTWYKKFQEFMADCEDPMETIYDYYTDEERILLFKVVEAEVGDLGGFDEKCNVASVIFNRIDSDKFGDTLSDVLTKKQFATISNGRYKKVTASEETIMACEFVFQFGDTTGGALFFESGNSNVHDAYATYMFKDNAGHKFYK